MAAAPSHGAELADVQVSEQSARALLALAKASLTASREREARQAAEFETARTSYLTQIRDLEGRVWAARRLLAKSESPEANAVLHVLNHPAE